jgi:hypothetical protein
MSKQAIGPREQALRDAREQNAKASKPTVQALAAALPATSGKKPIKKKRKAKR